MRIGLAAVYSLGKHRAGHLVPATGGAWVGWSHSSRVRRLECCGR